MGEVGWISRGGEGREEEGSMGFWIGAGGMGVCWMGPIIQGPRALGDEEEGEEEEEEEEEVEEAFGGPLGVRPI